MKKTTGLNFLGSHNLGLPVELKQDSYLIEYLPGTYGDFVSGIISYSIEEFYEHYSETGLDWNDRYWNEHNSILQRNRYPLSLRGSGYEHVENFTEFMLAHHLYTCIPKSLDTKKTKILFNCHPRLGDGEFRVLDNKLYKTEFKFLLPKITFDIVFQCAVNDYLSGFDHLKDDKNNSKLELYQRFKYKLFKLEQAKKRIPEKNILHIEDIRDITPEHISFYGLVNEKKFKNYKDDYLQRKIDMLEWNTKRIYEKMRALNPDRYKIFRDVYENRHEIEIDENIG